MRIVAVVAVAVCCLVACGSDPLDECLESLDPVGHFDCSYQDFTGVDLSGRNLRQADLRNSVLKGADLTGVNLLGAVAGEDTRWPAWFDPVKHGVIFH